MNKTHISFFATGMILASAVGIGGCGQTSSVASRTTEAVTEHAQEAELAEAEVARLKALEEFEAQQARKTRKMKPNHKAVAREEVPKEKTHKEKTHKEKTQSSKSVAATKIEKRAPASVKVYVVQVGAFRVEENAKRLHEQLKSAGYPVLIRSKEGKSGTLHFVRLEPTNNKAEARTMMEKLKVKESMESTLLALPDNG